MTVMFCDLVGSTQMSEQLDPEELREIILAYRDVCAASITRYDGSIARYLGDGILVYFGYPRAHEDDPRRAILAALDIRLGMQRLNESIAARGWPRLDLRIGIHTGLVVAGDMGTAMTHEPMAVVGSAPNIAARLQAVAAPNAIIVSAVTRDLASGWFEVRSLGARMLAGVAEPIEIVEVLAESGIRDRLGTRPMHATLRGRARELEMLLDRWQRVGSGIGGSHCIVIEGDPGIGKSRLLLALRTAADIDPARSLRCQCAEYYETSPFHPISVLIQHALADRRESQHADLAAELADSLEPSLADLLDLSAEDLRGTTAAQSGAVTQDATSVGAMEPAARRQRLIDGLADWIVAAAQDEAVLFTIEDLQWADDSTLAFLRALVERAADSRLLIVATTRPGGSAVVGEAPNVIRVALHGLSLDEARELVVGTAGKPLPEEMVTQILARAEGVPLFVEELTRTVIASPLLIEKADRYELGAGGAPHIPTTLRDSLMARLDSLGGSKRVAQIASVIGRSFPELLIRLVLEIREPLLAEHLKVLIAAQFFLREAEEEAIYAFTHVLLQDAAYDSLLRRTRQRYHRRTAEILEAVFADTAVLQPEILARHYGMAGDAVRAVDLWEKAGRRSASRSANVEAAAQIKNALDLLPQLPDDEPRRRTELRLQIALGGQMIITAGNADPRVEIAFERARRLSEELNEPAMLFQAQRGLLSFYQVRGRPRVARGLGERMLAYAESAADPDLLIQAHRAVGLCRLFLGELRDAERHLAEALDRCRAAAGTTPGHTPFISDPVVLTECNLGWACWFRGRPDRAAFLCAEAVQRARSVRHQHSLAYALGISAAVHQGRLEPEQTLSAAEEVMALGGRAGFSYWRAWARGFRGWARAALGDIAAGLGDLDTALAEYAATGAEVMRPYFLRLKAEILSQSGRPAEAAETLALAEADVAAYGMCFVEAEILRLRASLAHSADDRDTAIVLYDRAEEAATAQGAEILRLRIACDRVRAVGNGALPALQAVYDTMSEGQDTPDMKDAAALLAASKPLTLAGLERQPDGVAFSRDSNPSN